MKLKSLLVLSAGALLMVPTMNSCKKGEDDPGLSLRSRTSRLAGEWTLKELKKEDVTTRIKENSVGLTNELLEETTTSTMTATPSGVILSEEIVETYDAEDFNQTESITRVNTHSGTTFTSVTEVKDKNGTRTSESSGDYESSYSVTMTFEKDGTFKMTRNMSTKTTTTELDTGSYSTVTVEEDIDELSFDGHWSFIDGNEASTYKNKERIGIWFEDRESKVENIKNEDVTDLDDSDFFDYTDSKYEKTTYDDETESSESHPDAVWVISRLSNKELVMMSEYTYNNESTTTSEYTISGVPVKTISVDEVESTGTDTYTMEAK